MENNPSPAPWPAVRKVFICSNGKCASSVYAREMFDLLMEYIEEHQLDSFDCPHRVKGSLSGCLDICENGPIMVVQPDRIWYHQINTERLKLIFEEHFINNQPVEEFILKRG